MNTEVGSGDSSNAFTTQQTTPGTESAGLLEIKHLKLYFEERKGILGGKVTVYAVDDVDLRITEGEVLSLVGESGSGKSTLARAIVKLNNPSGGEILFKGENILKQNRTESKAFRRRVQMIFQDPYEALNPQADVYNTVVEPLVIHGLVSRNKDERKRRVSDLLGIVGLDSSTKMGRYPHELSGGERQRVAIARALSLRPTLLIADEPVSMLDVSLRIGLLNLMLDLKRSFNLSLLFITHDLGVAKYVGSRIAVMYFGKIVEVAPSADVVDHPIHPYTELLLSSVPQSPRFRDDRAGYKQRDFDYVASSTNRPSGCRFHPRCPYAQEKCKVEEPVLLERRKGHFAACHFPLES